MPRRFKEVVPNLLYRGAAPQSWEIPVLKGVFNIQQIISLDKEEGEEIDKDCAKNDILHIIIPLNATNDNDSDLNLIRAGVTKLINNKPTYVHCYHGKDRTGLFVAKFRTENGFSCKAALDEAISFGFGIGMDKDVIKQYIDIIVSSCKFDHKHVDIEYYYPKTSNAVLCDECEMLKTSNYCEHCIITHSLIRSANILSKNIVDEERDILNKENLNKDEENIGGGSEISQLFSVPENIVTAIKRRTKLLNLINKQAGSQISFVIPKEEKDFAKQCIIKLNELNDDILFKAKINDDIINILDIIYNPFNEHSGITTEQANKIKSHINIFIELLNNNMILVKHYAVECLNILEKFKSDSSVSSMNKSFFDNVDNIDKETQMFIKVLENTGNKDFQSDIINSIKILKKSSAQLKQLIEERIIPYLRKDILGEDWTTEIKQDLQEDKVEQRKEQKIPLQRR